MASRKIEVCVMRVGPVLREVCLGNICHSPDTRVHGCDQVAVSSVPLILWGPRFSGGLSFTAVFCTRFAVDLIRGFCRLCVGYCPPVDGAIVPNGGLAHVSLFLGSRVPSRRVF